MASVRSAHIAKTPKSPSRLSSVEVRSQFFIRFNTEKLLSHFAVVTGNVIAIFNSV